MTWARVLACSALLTTTLTWRSEARAQTPQDKAASQALFDEGRKLMAEGKLDAACPKLAASQKLDPGAGTLLNLAACYEKAGKTASAWVTYTDAATASDRSSHADWAKRARTKADALRPNLVSLVIEAPNAPPSLEVTRDGVVVSAAELGAALPVDPGTHRVEAHAPGKRSWALDVNVTRPRQTLTVPTLEDEPVAAPPPAVVATPLVTKPPPEVVPSFWRPQRVAGAALAGVGVVGLALGATFGLLAKHAQASTKGHCIESGTRCDASGFEHNHDAHRDAAVSTVGFIAGGALFAGGAVLFATARSGRSKGREARVESIPGGAALNFGGSF